MSFAHELAAAIGRDRGSPLSHAASAAVRSAVIDAVGVGIAGSREPLLAKLRRISGPLSENGLCTLLGDGARGETLDAAFLNAGAIHALDFDDSSLVTGAHPSATLLPAALAFAEWADASGRDLVEAYATGFDVMTRIARCVMPDHYERGWHPTSTLGVFGAAAAAASILGSDDRRMAVTLCIAASMASGMKANFGTDTKPLHAARASRDGVSAALLAAEGMSASEDAFEHRQGFFALYGGLAPEESWNAALSRRQRDGELVDPGIATKPFACCGSTQAAAAAALALHGRLGRVGHEASLRVAVRMHPSRLAHTDRPVPRSGTDAKFSVQYVVACALANGTVLLEHFRCDALAEPRVAHILDKVSVAADAALDPFEAIVRVEPAPGRSLEERRIVRFGRDVFDPMTEAERSSKFMDCTSGILADDRAAALLNLLGSIEDQRVREVGSSITQAVAGGGLGRGRS